MDRRSFIRSLLATYLIQSFITIFYLYPMVLRAQGLSLAAIGWMMSVFNIASTSARPLGGIMTEKIGVRRTLILSCFLLTLSAIPMSLDSGFSLLLLFRIAMGGCFGLAAVALSSYQALAVPKTGRGRLYAWIGTAYVIPQITVLPLAEAMAARDFYFVYLSMPVFLGILCLLSAVNLPSISLSSGDGETEGTPADRTWGGWGELFRVHGFWALISTLVLFALVNSAMLQYMPAMARDRNLIASAFMATNATMALLLRIGAGRIMDRFSRTAMAGLTIGIMGVALMLSLLCGNNFTFAFCGALYGIGMGFGFPIMLALTPDIFPPRLRPKGVSISLLAFDLGFMASPLLVGYAGELLGLSGIMGTIGLIAALGGPLLYLLYWRNFGLSRA